MKDYSMLMLYKNNREHTIEEVKKICQDAQIYLYLCCVEGNVCEEWDKFQKLNIGRLIFTASLFNTLIKKLYKKGYKINELEMWEEKNVYIDDCINLVNSDVITNQELKTNIIQLFTNELNYQDREHDNSIKSFNIYKNNVLISSLSQSTIKVNEDFLDEINELFELIESILF